MTLYAREIEEIVQTKSSNSLETVPKRIQYYASVSPATRPLLLSVLKERLERLGCPEDNWQSFLAPTKALISTGIKSALKTLQILTDENSVLEVFLPFELEVTFGVALYHMMAETLFPHATEGQSYSHEVHSILDETISKGNRLGAARKTELTHLESLFRELAAQVKRYGLQTLTLTTPDNDDTGMYICHGDAHQSQQTAIDPALDEHGFHLDSVSSPSLPHLGDSVELLSEIGTSSYKFSSIIEQIRGAESSVLDPRPSWTNNTV